MNQAEFNRKYRLYQILLIISLFVVWLPGSILSGIPLEHWQRDYLDGITGTGEQIFSNGGRLTIIPNFFLILFVWMYFFNWIMLKIFKLPSWEMDARSWEVARQAGAPGTEPTEPPDGRKLFTINRVIKTVAIITVFVALVADALLFFSYTKTTETGLVRRSFFQQETRYDWDDLLAITSKQVKTSSDPWDDPRSWFELHFGGNRTVELSNGLSDPDAKAIAEIASREAELPIVGK